MTEHQQQAQNQTENDEYLCIIQINLNKSEKAHLDIINKKVSTNYDIMLIQEPYTTTFNTIHSPANFRPIFPINKIQNKEQIQLVIWVNKRLDTKNWMILKILGSNNLTALQIQGQYGKILILNIYNNCSHSRNEIILKRFIQEHTNLIINNENHHMIWAGNFN